MIQNKVYKIKNMIARNMILIKKEMKLFKNNFKPKSIYNKLEN